MRADRWILNKYESLTRTQAHEAFELGWVLQAARPLKKGDRITDPSAVDTSQLEAQLETLARGNGELEIDIIHEDKDFWVIDKPANVLGHPLHLKDSNTVTQWAFGKDPAICKEFSSIQPCLTPHRLDTGTSGLLIVAKTKKSYDRWREYFSLKKIEKSYMAWCWGKAESAAFSIKTRLKHDPSDRRKMIATEDESEEIKSAESQVTEVKHDSGHSLFEISCRTGVMHQVRAHLSGAGFPLLGDSLYDAQFAEREIKPPYHLLRAVKLITPEGEFTAESTRFVQMVHDNSWH